MYNEWSLDILYKGVDDPALNADLETLKKTVDEYKATVAALNAEKPAESLRAVIEMKEKMGVLVRRLAGFFSLRRSTNASDTAVAGYMTKISALMAGNAKENTLFEKFVGDIDDLDAVIASDELQLACSVACGKSRFNHHFIKRINLGRSGIFGICHKYYVTLAVLVFDNSRPHTLL